MIQAVKDIAESYGFTGKEDGMRIAFTAVMKKSSKDLVRKCFHDGAASRTKMIVIKGTAGKGTVMMSAANQRSSLLKLFAGGKVLAKSQYQQNINIDVRHGGRKLGTVRMIPYKAVQKFADSIVSDRLHVKPLRDIDPNTKIDGAFIELEECFQEVIRLYDEMDAKPPRKGRRNADKVAAERKRFLRYGYVRCRSILQRSN